MYIYVARAGSVLYNVCVTHPRIARRIRWEPMNRPFGKREKVQISLLTLACVIVVLGILFLVNAMQEDPANGFFPAFCAMDNILAKYIIVILTMACGIMLFSNVAVTLEDRKLRNGLTIGVTTFSTVLTVPLVYVFIAILPYAGNPVPFEQLNALDAIMRMDLIYQGFVAWFRDGAFMWVVLVFMLLLSIVFITFPLVTGILAVKCDKTLGFKKKGGFGVIVLPVVAKQLAAAEAAGETTVPEDESEPEAAFAAACDADKAEEAEAVAHDGEA